MSHAERENAILGLESKVRLIASARWRRLHSVGFDEILSAAWLGAIQAVDGHDPARGPLDVYADWKIRSAIGDYLRSVDTLSREHRRAVRAGSQAAPRRQGLHIEAKHGEMPLSISDPRDGREIAAMEARLDVDRLLRRARLTDGHVAIINAHANGEVMKDIGKAFGISESRVSQIRSAALQRLRAAA